MAFDNEVVVLWVVTGVSFDDVTGGNTAFGKALAAFCIADSWTAGCNGDSSLREGVWEWP